MKQALLAAASLLVMVVTLEVGFRLLSFFPGTGAVFVNDHEHQIVRVRSDLAIGAITTNSLGFNDRDWARDKPGGVTRVALVGDSNVFAAYVPREDAVTGRLAAQAAAAGYPAEFLNFGIPGVGPWNYQGLVEYLPGTFDVDTVLVLFSVMANLRAAHPDFRDRVVFGHPRQVLLRPYQVRLEPEYWYAYRFLRSRYREVGGLRGVLGPAADRPAARFLELSRTRLPYFRRDPRPFVEEVFRGAFGYFDRLHALAAAQGAALAIVLAPSPLQLDAALRDTLAARHGLDLSAYDFPGANARLTNHLAAAGIPALDLLTALRDGADRYYLPSDFHWSAAGNAEVARAVWAFLLDEGLVRARVARRAPPPAAR